MAASYRIELSNGGQVCAQSVSAAEGFTVAENLPVESF
jgi:hypothetical protein